jgi:UDP-GlcNAc:undecaprenyl-phosphate GlcNAc-1-phosphate transferase
MFNSFYLILAINVLFFLFFQKIQNKLNIFDKPNLKRKIHTNPTSSAGGILFTLCLLIYFTSVFFGIDKNFLSYRENFSIIIFIFFFFIMGIYDDKFHVQPYTRLLFSIFFILILLLLNNNFIIKELRFSFLNYIVLPQNFEILFTVICALLFINACNMFDGINLQFGLYIFLLSIIFYSKNLLPDLQITIIVCCLFFLYFNFNKKLFIGNNGTLVIGALFSVLFIKFYNFENSLLFADEIFLYMSVPGFDLARVSFARLINGKNIFEADKNHIHHLLHQKFNFLSSTILVQIIIIIPILYAFFTKQYIYAIFISLGMYVALIFYVKKIIKS